MEPPHRGLSLRDELRQPRIEHGQRTVSCVRALRFDAAALVGLRRLDTRRRTLRYLDGLHRRRKLRSDGVRRGHQTACPDCGQRFAKMGAPYCLVILIDDAVSIAISRGEVRHAAAERFAPHDVVGCIDRAVAVVVTG